MSCRGRDVHGSGIGNSIGMWEVCVVLARAAREGAPAELRFGNVDGESVDFSRARARSVGNLPASTHMPWFQASLRKVGVSR
jgi:hypothetical protein